MKTKEKNPQPVLDYGQTSIAVTQRRTKCSSPLKIGQIVFFKSHFIHSLVFNHTRILYSLEPLKHNVVKKAFSLFAADFCSCVNIK